MIAGVVNSRYEFRICVPVLSRDGAERGIDAVLDTGFSGFLSLPRAVIDECGLTWRTFGRAVLADNRVETFDLYDAILMLDGRPKHIAVYAIEGTPLLGVNSFVDFSLRVRIQVGGRVELERLTG